MTTRDARLARAILAARQSVCLAEMLHSGKHIFCWPKGKYVPARELLPNAAKRPRGKPLGTTND